MVVGTRFCSVFFVETVIAGFLTSPKKPAWPALFFQRPFKSLTTSVIWYFIWHPRHNTSSVLTRGAPILLTRGLLRLRSPIFQQPLNNPKTHTAFSSPPSTFKARYVITDTGKPKLIHQKKLLSKTEWSGWSPLHRSDGGRVRRTPTKNIFDHEESAPVTTNN